MAARVLYCRWAGTLYTVMVYRVTYRVPVVPGHRSCVRVNLKGGPAVTEE